MSSTERCTQSSRGHSPTARPRGETSAGRRGHTARAVASTGAGMVFLSCPEIKVTRIKTLACSLITRGPVGSKKITYIKAEPVYIDGYSENIMSIRGLPCRKVKNP